MSLDLSTGEHSVLIDTWPWTEPVASLCVRDVVVDQAGERAFAIVVRFYGEGEECVSRDLVSIDLGARMVIPIQNLEQTCASDDWPDFYSYLWMQFDDFQQRLLYIETDCDPSNCDYHVSATPFGTSGNQPLHSVHEPDCDPADDDCSRVLEVAAMSFDPADPDHRVLVLVQNRVTDRYHIDSLELTTGAITPVVDILPMVGNLRLDRVVGLSVDAEKQRVLLTGRGVDGALQWSWVVIAVDLVTKEQSVLYDGSPAADGSVLRCAPRPAFDSRARRLLLVESGRYDCPDDMFTVDADTGEFSHLSNGANP